MVETTNVIRRYEGLLTKHVPNHKTRFKVLKTEEGYDIIHDNNRTWVLLIVTYPYLMFEYT